ncbi:MAG: hypothetical protein VKL41_21850 [Snowella sp.]|nr:hypothetical protein [Snowella sp.]
MGEAKRRKAKNPDYGQERSNDSVIGFDLIQPKEGRGNLSIGNDEFLCEWAALGCANLAPNSPNQKGFLIIKTSENMYAFVGNKPLQKKFKGFDVQASEIVNGKYQWQLSVVRMIIITQNNKEFKFEGEVLADRLFGLVDAYIYMNGLIVDDSLSNFSVSFKFKQLHELPPITNLKLNF